MNRVLVVGASGSGKSTLASQLSHAISAKHVELDELFHRPNWEPTPTPEFRAKVSAALEVDRWVVAGNYSMVMDITAGRADTIAWIDLPRWQVMAQIIVRSLRRVITRKELWNGNREHWRDLLSRDPEKNIVVWSWQTHGKLRRRYADFASGKFWAHADVHRLQTRRDVRQFLSEH